MFDLIKDFGSATFLLSIYGVCFFILYKLTDDNKHSPSNIKNFIRIHNQDKFFDKNLRLEACYYFFNRFISDFFGNLITLFLALHLLTPLIPYQLFAPQIEALPFHVKIFLGTFIADAAFFFPHWFSHKFLWRFHSIHHSAEKLTWITALRLHPVDHIAFAIGGTIAMHIIGFDGQAIIYGIIIHSTYNLFVHIDMSLEYQKPLCYILGSPNYHRWHHATDKEAIDKNLATMFPIFDLIFGTYYHPKGKLPKSYGLNGKKSQSRFPQTFGKQLLYPFRKKH